MEPSDPYYRPAGWGGPPPRRPFRWLRLVIGLVFVVLTLIILLVFLYPGAFGLSSSPTSRVGPFGGFFVFFFVIVIAFFIVRVAFWTARSGGSYGRRYNAMQGHPSGYAQNQPLMVARMRYARGEITREQYEQLVSDLGPRRGPP